MAFFNAVPGALRMEFPMAGVQGPRNLVERSLDSDQSLIARCLSGDETAWEDLVRQYSRQVYGLCFRFTGSAPAAQDLTQEVYLRVFRTLRTFRAAEGSFGTWLTRVTRNLLIDHYRRTRQERATDSIEEQLPMMEDSGPAASVRPDHRSEEHTSELQSLRHLVC